MTYIIEGLVPDPFLKLAGFTDEALRALCVVRREVTECPGFPCRVTLADAPVGSNVLLLNHVSRDGATPYRASHAIFVQEGPIKPGRYQDLVPPVMQQRALSLRGFDGAGMMVDAKLTQPGEADEGLLELFRQSDIVEVDVHNAVRGCFAARARRA